MDRRRDKFVELAEKRVSRALKDLHLIGNLSNRSNYAYTDEDVKKIISAIEGEVRNLKKRFENSVEEPTFLFKL